MVKSIYNTIQALTDVSLKRDNGTLLVLPTASGAVFNPGIGVTDIMAMSRVGEQVIVDTYSKERKPTISLDFEQKSIQTIGVRLGQQWEALTTSTGHLFNSGLKITQGVYPAALVGYEGFGMTADNPASTASLLGPNQVPVVLTRQPFATFIAGTPKSFAQGPNGAVKWSDDLIGEYVGYEFPYPLSNILALGDLPDTSFSMKAITMMTDRSLIEWAFPSITVKLDGGDINMNDPKMQLQFKVNDDGSTCLPYSITYKGQAQRRKCIAD
jgi:hypothetical protein